MNQPQLQHTSVNSRQVRAGVIISLVMTAGLRESISSDHRKVLNDYDRYRRLRSEELWVFASD